MLIEMAHLNPAKTDVAEESVPLKPWSATGNRRKSIWLDTWLFESLALVFSIACFVAILGLLGAYNNEVRPEMAYKLSLNAIISILATGCKSSLALVIGEAICQLKWLHFKSANKSSLSGMQMFDAASRGPFGSLGIFIHQKAQSFVCLGATVIVLLLAFDPFMQQVISYPVRLSDISDGQAITKQLYGAIPGDFHDWEFAFGQGLWAQKSFDISPVCSSGNCTWKEFSSVGICNKCFDVTSSAQLKCNLGNATSWFNQTCEITLPDNVGIGYNFSVTMQHHFADWSVGPPSNGSGNALQFPGAMIWTTEDSEDLIKISVGGLMTPLAVFAYAELFPSPQVSFTAPLSNRISIKNVTVCAHTTCLRDYHISMENGRTSIQTVNVDFGIRTPDYPNDLVHWTPNNKSKIGFAFDEVQFLPDGGPSNQFLVTVSSGFFPIEKYPTIFIFDFMDNQWMGDDSYNPNPVIDHIKKIGFASLMSDVAASFTQMGLEKSNDTVNGTVQTSKVFVSVQWYWVTLPACLVVVGAIFFIGTTILNRKANMPLWKSSALAPFYHGLEEWEGNEFQSSSIMETAAEREDVRLRYSEANGRLMLQRR
ncbi:unnamed protein product [Penicillium salamii]|uniref:Uncharacterized protein n=1 Tax=Penicillium salamii TaxID=1612424 RepID=A0A9W4NQC1_9EURO|nr:unnamed protein product [Penicillium salamii]